MHNSLPVEISGLTKSYGDVKAVDDLSLVVKTGEVHGLLGPNGAGKTTVLKCLLGITPPSLGSVLIYGSKVLDLPDPALVVGVMMEDGLDNQMTVGRHLRASAIGSGTGMQRVYDLVEECGLSGLEKQIAEVVIARMATPIPEYSAFVGCVIGPPPTSAVGAAVSHSSLEGSCRALREALQVLCVLRGIHAAYGQVSPPHVVDDLTRARYWTSTEANESLRE